jgi:hypothetical protein
MKSIITNLKKILSVFYKRQKDDYFCNMYKEYLFNGLEYNIGKCAYRVINSHNIIENNTYLTSASFLIELNSKCQFKLIIEEEISSTINNFEIKYTTIGLDSYDPNDYVTDLQIFVNNLNQIRGFIKDDCKKMMY